MRRRVWIGIGLIILALGAGGYALFGRAGAQPPIVVGLLHSQTGPLAGKERPMIDAEVLALEEINAEGGLLGRPVTWIVADGRSSEAAFAQQAQRLITIDKVSAIFGISASRCRKGVKPVIEENGHLLFHPAAYEGAEESPHIVYTGGPANQQVGPAVGWCIEALKARTFFLVGTDSIWSRVVNALTGDFVKARGGRVVAEEYLLPDQTDVSGVVGAIKRAAPDVVINALEDGGANDTFYTRLRQAGILPGRPPVVSFTITEEELRSLPPRDLVGHYSARNYFQSVDRPENEQFVRRFKARYGPDRVTSDGVSTAYNSVKLWAQAVAEAGTDQVAEVLKAARRQSLDAPEGVVSVDPDNLNNWRPFFLGQVRADGQFEVVHALPKPIHPDPYPRTRSRAEWDALLSNLSSGWGGQWANPARSVARGGGRVENDGLKKLYNQMFNFQIIDSARLLSFFICHDRR